jgi:hypothetical protein
MRKRIIAQYSEPNIATSTTHVPTNRDVTRTEQQTPALEATVSPNDHLLMVDVENLRRPSASAPITKASLRRSRRISRRTHDGAHGLGHCRTPRTSPLPRGGGGGLGRPGGPRSPCPETGRFPWGRQPAADSTSEFLQLSGYVDET